MQADSNSISDGLRFIKNETQACVSCGACQGVCPIYQVEPLEKHAARGKLKLLKAADQGFLEYDQELARDLKYCLLCGRCSANCPNGIQGAESFSRARRILKNQGKDHSPPATLLAQAVKNAKRLNTLVSAARVARPALEKLFPPNSGLWLKLPGLKGLDKLPAMAQQPFLKQAPQEIPGPAGAPRLAFFVGCMANHLRTDLAWKAVRILSKAFTVVIPQDQGCCGLPALSAGNNQVAGLLARTNMTALEQAGADLIVTTCASCAHALSKDLPGVLPLQFEGRALDIAGKVREISQVLAENQNLVKGRAHFAGPVAVHDPCHLKIGLKASEEPRVVLRAAGLDITEMTKPDACCGGGGLLPLNQRNLSEKIFQPRAEDLEKSGALALATSCSGCFTQWRRFTQEGIKVVHPVELLQV
jgi:glycolate oxidase iron-sulfur subunit